MKLCVSRNGQTDSSYDIRPSSVTLRAAPLCLRLRAHVLIRGHLLIHLMPVVALTARLTQHAISRHGTLVAGAGGALFSFDAYRFLRQTPTILPPKRIGVGANFKIILVLFLPVLVWVDVLRRLWNSIVAAKSFPCRSFFGVEVSSHSGRVLLLSKFSYALRFYKVSNVGFLTFCEV